MENIYVFNINKKFISKIDKNKYNINVIDISKIEKEINNKISPKNLLYNDYLRLYIAYNNNGLVVDGDFEIVSDLDIMFKDSLFIGYNNVNTVRTNIIYTRNKNNEIIKEVLDSIATNNDNMDITDIFSKVLNVDLKKIVNTTYFSDSINIYSYDYLYPVDYEKNGKQFSENTRIIFYEDRPLGIGQKTKLKMFKKYGGAAAKYISTTFAVLKYNIASRKYQKQVTKGIGIDKKRLHNRVIDAVRLIEEYDENSKDYITIHNPYWMGVTSATKELFENLVPIEELYDSSDINMIAQAIHNSNNIKQVIFSAFNVGWDDLARRIKELDSTIKVKIFWHGSNSQVIDTQNWINNVKGLQLQKDGIVDVFATCKESLLNYYKHQGYNTFFLKNTVRLDDTLISKVKNTNKKMHNKDTKLNIGIYSANMDWRKNMFNQLAAVSLIENTNIRSIPLNFDGQVFCSKVGQSIEGSLKGVPREELLLEMSKNDLNVYVTFSECAPMLPIESMEVGTICITGDNHHYFKNTPLEEYLVVKREDDIIAISEKIRYALDNKDKIFKLYKEWKKNYDNESLESVKEFLNI